jgi:ankyrin repeat protein
MWNILRRRGDSALDGRLLKAAADGDAAAVADLLAKGADPDARDPKSGRTAGHFGPRSTASWRS